MIMYEFDRITGKYTGIHEPQIDPLTSEREGKIVYFGHKLTTEIKPPDLKKNEQCFFEDGKWVIYEDVIVYNKESRHQNIICEKDFNETTHTKLIPLSLTAWCEWDGSKWIENTEKKKEIEYILALKTKRQEIINRMAIEELEAEGITKPTKDE